MLDRGYMDMEKEWIEKIHSESTIMYKFYITGTRRGLGQALKEKFEALSNMPHVITDDLIVHYTWFSGRVRKLLTGDLGRKVGNS